MFVFNLAELHGWSQFPYEYCMGAKLFPTFKGMIFYHMYKVTCTFPVDAISEESFFFFNVVLRFYLCAETSYNLILVFYCILVFFFSFLFLGSHLQHMEVPRLGVELELQLLA